VGAGVVTVDGQPTALEQYRHTDRYRVAAGRIDEVVLALSAGGVPIEDVRLERLADPPPFPARPKHRARARRPLLRRLLRLP
jgi:hypothetical protein